MTSQLPMKQTKSKVSSSTLFLLSKVFHCKFQHLEKVKHSMIIWSFLHEWKTPLSNLDKNVEMLRHILYLKPNYKDKGD
uniref:Uncharacterized protein n=1 Tax=Cucumis melo TaxID=3656 RepID=A0A9I9E5A9_CUCME